MRRTTTAGLSWVEQRGLTLSSSSITGYGPPREAMTLGQASLYSLKPALKGLKPRAVCARGSPTGKEGEAQSTRR